jgi:hypothetical protein
MDAQAEMMPELIVVFDEVKVRDSRGGTTITYVERPLRIIGRVGKVTDQMQYAYAGQLRGKATAVLTVPVGSNLNERCKVHVLGGDYMVVADLSRSSYSTASRYLIEEI